MPVDLNTTIPWQRGDVLLPFVMGLVFTPVLILCCRLVTRDGVEFGDAIKTSVAATVASFLADVGLKFALDPGGLAFWSASSAVAFAMWVLAILIIIGMDLRRTVLIALIFVALRIPLIILIQNTLLEGMIRR